MPVYTIKAGLLGMPLSKSLSPEIFKIFSTLTGAEIVYELRECGAAELPAVVHALRAAGWAGFNITLPHKRAVFSLLNLADPAARAVKAANAARFGRSGLEGTNTDAAAIRAALEENSAEVSGKKATIFGAGGSAGAAGWALGRCGAAEVTFHARNKTAAQKLAGDLAGTFAGTRFSAAGFEKPEGCPDILVNATPLGMYAPGRPPCEPGRGSVCLDLAYAAGGTEFMAAARAAGAKALDGLEVLVRQASLSLKFWAGLPAGDIVEFNTEALKRLREAK
jgi:shikimate dehydrogenase